MSRMVTLPLAGSPGRIPWGKVSLAGFGSEGGMLRCTEDNRRASRTSCRSRDRGGVLCKGQKGNVHGEKFGAWGWQGSNLRASSWPSNAKHGYEPQGPTCTEVVYHTTKVVSLPRGVLDNTFFSQAYFIERMQHKIHTRYKILSINRFYDGFQSTLSYWSLSSRDWELTHGFSAAREVHAPNPPHCQGSTVYDWIFAWNKAIAWLQWLGALGHSRSHSAPQDADRCPSIPAKEVKYIPNGR